MLKPYWSHDKVEDILHDLDYNGLVIFADSKTGFERLYREKLIDLLPPEMEIVQDYTNHPTEGYFYFLYDQSVYSREQAIRKVLEFRS